MELIEYGNCQVVNLMNVFRSRGAPYLPEIAAKIVTKYQFAKPPSIDDLQKEIVKFQIGRFNDVQISEFGIYNDGIVVSGKCPTEFLEGFVSDVLGLAKEFGLVPILENRHELHFESNIVVRSKADLASCVFSVDKTLIQKTMEEKIGVHFQPSGFILDCDLAAIKTRRKPSRVYIERRQGFNSKENIFFCVAPLRTSDHVELLSALEREVNRSA
jgi:hypothetical protein